LIVDDHDAARRAVRSLVASCSDWQVCGEAVDGVDAVEKAKTLRPDVILMDISMPRMSGLDATKIIRKDLPESKVVIVSQNEPAIVRIQAREAGATAHIAKKDIVQDLVATIEKVTGRQNPAPSPAPGPNGRTPLSSGWLAGDGEMARLIRTKNWSQTSLGPLENWPQSLKIAVNLMINSRHPMWVGWGREMLFLYNDAYISVLGLSKHPNALGCPAEDVWQEIWDICGPLAAKVFEKGEATLVEDVRLFMNRGGFLEENYYSFSYNPIYDEDGKVAGLFCPNTDTTPKVLNARRLQTLSELTAKAFVERSADAACASSFSTLAKNPDDIPFALLYLLDADGKQAFLEQSTGVSQGIGRMSPAQMNLDIQSPESQFWRMNEILTTGLPEIVSLEHLDSLPKGLADQSVAQAIILPVTSGRQYHPIGMLIAGVNPTRKLDSEYQTFYELLAGQVATAIQNARTAEEDRKRADALAEIDRAKTVFFSNVSHEFRTPLTLMLGPVEDLLSRSHTDLSPAAKNQLELVNRNGSRLLRLVNTLLDFSRIEAGRMQAVYQRTDLSAFTIELASVFRSATEKAGLRLELDCRHIEEPIFIDRDMWEKIVLNLISNAFKFTFEGEIAISLIPSGKYVELRVRDTGVGIPANEIPRLFDRFHRVQNTRSRTHEGSGIGLALVQELVRLHSGMVRVESAPGKGSTFIVSLPVGSAHLPGDRIGGARSSASTAVGATPFLDEALGWLPISNQTLPEDELPTGLELMQVPCPPVSGNGEASAKRAHVLIADDNADMRKYLDRLLAEKYEVHAVPNGKAALESAREHVPDLILSDVMMPELDGFGLVQELRSDPNTKTIPVILLSARAGEESRVEGMEHGADDYLIKPFSARELLARVQTHLEMSRVRKQAEENLLRRTEQFETLLNEAPLAVYMVDGNFRIRAMNPPALRAFGNIQGLIGSDFGEVIHKRWPRAYADEIVQRFRHTLETGEPYVVPERIEERLDSGAREVYEWQISRIALPDGDYGVVCYFRNITQQVDVRDAIAGSEERLRLATEAADLGIWQWYPDEDRIVWENDRIYDIFSRTREDGPITGTEFRARVCHPDHLEAFERAMSQTLESGDRFFFRGCVYRKDRSEAWVEMTGQLDRQSEGKPRRILGTVLDVTDRQRKEQALRDSEERLRLAQKTAHSGTWDWNMENRDLICSPEMHEVFGLDPGLATLDAEKWRRMLDPDDLKEVDKALAQAIEGHTEFRAKFRITRLDGAMRWLETLAQIFYKDNGDPARIVGISTDITERKEIEDRERKIAAEAMAATAKFRAVFEQSSVFAGIMTLDGIVIDANRLSVEVCGYRTEEVLGRHFWDCGWWRESREVQDKIRAGTAQAAAGTAYLETLPYRWADGSEHLVDFALHPIIDDKGEVIFLHPTGVDITERKQAERATGLLAAIVDSSDDAIVSKNLDGIITSWNRGAERVFGYTAEEAIGRHITLIIPPERRDEETKLLERLKRGERVEHFETVRVNKDGRALDISLSISPLKDSSGRVVGASKVARDVTDRKQIERALRDSEERFRAIFETTPECVKLVAMDGTLLHMNSWGLAMVGANRPDQAVGKNIYDLIAEKDRARFHEFNERICRGEKGSLEFDIVELGGRTRHMETHAAPLQMPDGTVVQLGVSRDITERARAEEKLRRSEEKLRALAEKLETQVRGRTRELEQRSAEIVQQSEQLRDLSRRLLQAQDQERRHIARELHDSAGQIVTVLSMNLGQIFQRARENAPLIAKEVDECQALVQQLSQEIRTTSYLLYPPLLDETGLNQALSWYIQGLTQRSGLEIDLSISENFGRLPREMELVVYRLVQECLTNIHRHSGSKNASIRLRREGEHIFLEVQDNGKGILPDKLNQLQMQGAGVGIRGMRERVRQLEGRMDIRSSESGTTISFTFHIPSSSTNSRSASQPVQATSN